MSFLQRGLYNLGQLGFYDFFLPFVLIVAVVFGILQHKKPIGENTNINGTIAVAIAFLATYIGRGFFYTQLFGGLGMGLAAFLVIVILLAMFGFAPGDLFKGFNILKPDTFMLSGLIFLVGVVIFLYAFGFDVIATILAPLSWLIDKEIILTFFLAGVGIGAIALIFMKK